jgi:hypothetical protein
MREILRGERDGCVRAQDPGSSPLGKKTSEGGSLAGSPDLQRCGYTNHAVQRQQQAAGSSSTHVRFSIVINFYFDRRRHIVIFY